MGEILKDEISGVGQPPPVHSGDGNPQYLKSRK